MGARLGQGVQAECEADLAPLGDIGTQLVNGLYKAGKDAGLNLNSMAALSAVPPGPTRPYVMVTCCTS